MKKIILMAVLTAIFFETKAQNPVVLNIVDKLSGEGLKATISIKNIKYETNSNGVLRLNLKGDSAFVVIDAQEYEDLSMWLKTNRNEYTIGLDASSLSMDAVRITASIASKDRKTPIVYSNITGKDIKEALGSADLPTLFNNTPGVYATQQGGGAGDARISIRGFNQRNIAVMIDGIPVNDMENGEVYWSNWYGLSEVTKFTQIQRGLGSSRLANPSVGGTINIITNSFSSKFGAKASLEIGDSRYQQYSATINTGQLKGNWGGIFSVTHRSSAGYVDGLFDEMYSFYGKLEKRFQNKLSVSLTFVGAPQSHGQRSFRAKLPLYSTDLSKKLGLDTISSTMVVNRGIRYNQHIGLLNRTELIDGKRIGTGQILQNERVNTFFKPQLYLKVDYKPSARVFNNLVVYASMGKGGGTSALLVNQTPSEYGQYNFQGMYNTNRYGSAFVPGAIDPAYSPTLRKSSGILRESVNNHKWIGLLNTTNYKINRNSTLNAGIDLRRYIGEHYRQVKDLLGGEYFRPGTDDTLPGFGNRIYKVGDKFDFYNLGYVTWLGTFAEYEYATKEFSFFVNGSLSNSIYQRKDYFKLDANGNAQSTQKETFLGKTIKTGFSYSVSKRVNLFTNLGYLDRPARFNNVFSNANTRVQNVANEKVLGTEAGINYHTELLSIEGNVYFTNWNNRPLNTLPSYVTPDGDQFSYNINGLKAQHRGLELKGIYKTSFDIDLQASIALGDWIWNSAANGNVIDESGNIIANVSFDAKGVHVGDAAQQQFVLSARFAPKQFFSFLNGFYLSAEAIYFGKHYSDFEPTTLTKGFERTESYKLPNYYMVNLNTGYTTYKFGNELKIYGSIRNLTNSIYISDAQHRLIGSDIASAFNPKNLEVFVSNGLRYTIGLSISL